ncbi:MAG: glycoside hydrolase family 2 protein, partial [Candidatus Zipacnadales bacterium]
MSASICLDGTDWKLLPLMPREWEWRRIWEKPEEKLTPLWIAARVPGTVQDDAFDAGLIPNYTRDFNSRACEWTSERDWVYLKKFTKPDLPTDGIARLRFEGVDYACHVFLNSQPLGAHEGMYEVFEFDITDQLVSTGPNILVVVVEHAPREVGQIGRTSEVRLWKARFAYDWDWCTRLVPLGIWDSVNLLVSGSAYIRDVQIATALEDDFSAAEVGIEVEVSTSRTQRVTLQGAISLRGTQVAVFQGSLLAKGASTRHSAAIHLKSPALWWPNGYGEQPLYEATVSLYDREGNCLDTRAVGFGLRHIRAIPNEGAPPEALPYCLEINGKRVFIKGWNWAPIQQLYGRPGPEMYARWLGLAARANCNLLRVWGGGLLEKECFYHLCDQLGIMVWQEFIQSSSGLDNRPSTDPEYLRYIRRQATKMVRRRRNHPSLVIWTGGNELMDDNWTPLDDSHPALAVLKKVVQRLDPDRIWYPTSAAGPVANARGSYVGQMQAVHGPWQNQVP